MRHFNGSFITAIGLALGCAGPGDGDNTRTSGLGLSGASASASASSTGSSGSDTDPSASESASAGDPTSDGATSSAATSGSSTTTGDPTTTTTTTTGDPTTGGDPPSCWGKSPVTWTVAALDTDALVGADPVNPMISADGLTLYYIAGPEEKRRPYRAVRASRDEPFAGGTIEAVWEGVADPLGHPWVLPERAEMLLVVADDIAASVHDGAVWGAPKDLGGPVASPAAEGHLSVTADGRRLLVQRQDGPDNPELGDTWRFHEFKRAADAPAGADFTTFGIVDIPGITDDDYPHANLCPTISPDGLHLFFGSSYPTVLTQRNLGDALNVFYTGRSDLDAAWETPVSISSFHTDGLETCPNSVTADGCTLIFHRFELGISGAGLFVASRTPE